MNYNPFNPNQSDSSQLPPPTRPSGSGEQQTAPANRPVYSFNSPSKNPSVSSVDDPKVKDGLRSVFSTVAILVLAPILAILITSFLFQSYEVDGESMETTLQNGDRLVVLKAAETWADITGKNYIPARGTVVVFEKPDSVEEKQLIKRVIALPGERVTVKNGLVTVYNSQKPQGFNPDKELPYGKVIKTTSGNVDLTVPENEVFVLGDNRGNSLDSRVFGSVKTSLIAGNLVLRVFPFNKTQKF